MNTAPVDTNEPVNCGNTDLEGIKEAFGSRLVVDDQTDCPDSGQSRVSVF